MQPPTVHPLKLSTPKLPRWDSYAHFADQVIPDNRLQLYRAAKVSEQVKSTIGYLSNSCYNIEFPVAYRPMRNSL